MKSFENVKIVVISKQYNEQYIGNPGKKRTILPSEILLQFNFVIAIIKKKIERVLFSYCVNEFSLF